MIAQCPWRAGVGWCVGFRGTRGAHKSVQIEVDWYLLKLCIQELKIRRDHSPLHAVHIRSSQSHLRAGLSGVAFPAIRGLVLTL